MLACLKTILLCVGSPLFQHFDLLMGRLDLVLRHLEAFEHVLMRLGENDEPVTDLLQETVRLPQLLLQVAA